MCGFAGIVHLNGRSSTQATDGPFLRAACGRLAQRGPDDEQFQFHGNVGFGFRRLAIVDLSNGAQPLCNEDESLVLMTNGEIYNHRQIRAGLRDVHRFRTASDCEVLLHAYEERGVDYVDDVNGMFATALLDRTRKRLLLVRDRLGIKPLYIYRNRELLLFASEIKALLSHPLCPRDIDWQQALTVDYLTPPAPGRAGPPSLFRGIEYVPAAHMIEVDLQSGEITTRRYWDPEAAAAARIPERSSDDIIASYRETLRDAVKLRLMADVEYGLFLSGGIDSVSIARFASETRAFHTFTVLSQSTLGNGDAESAFAAAKTLNLPNHQVLFDWRSGTFAPADWKRILWLTETPLANAEFLYKYYLHAFAKQLRPDLKMILLGQGSDEFNGGYTPQFASAVSDRRGEADQNWNDFLLAMDEHVVTRHQVVAGVRPGVLNMGDPARLTIRREKLAELAHATPIAHPWLAYRRMHLESLQLYNLWHEDRTAAAHGIENRVPFLDHRLVELCHAVPRGLWPELFWDKSILRRAMVDLIPESLRLRKKVPFFHGEDLRYTRRMMYGLLCAQGGALIEEAAAAAPDVLDIDAIRLILAELPDDPEMEAVDALVRVINTGLLQAMARAEQPLVAHENPMPVREVVAPDWQDLEKQVGVAMVARTAQLHEDAVVQFAPGVLLVRCEGGDGRAADVGAHYILIDNRLSYIIESRDAVWSRFLQHVDGTMTVGEIMSATDTERRTIWKHLEEALEHKVLELTSAAVEPVLA